MKKLFMHLNFVISSVFLILVAISCSKNSSNSEVIKASIKDTLTDRDKLSLQIFGNTEFKWNKNDSNYLDALKRLSKNFNLAGKSSIRAMNRVNSCSLNGGDSTYGWYSDPDSAIIEGPYTIAKNITYEAVSENCPDLIESAEEANQYLINERYSDIGNQYYSSIRPGLRYLVIHAANALIEIKAEFMENYSRSSGQQVQQKLVNCILQAIGYAAIAELGANWAAMSRQHIIRAVGKLAGKYLNWVGAAIAIVSFIDCMWG